MSGKGFTMVEMIIVVAIIATMLAIASPSFVNWRNSLYYRQTSRDITTMLRKARSMAMSMNRQHYVVFVPSNSGNSGLYAYRLIRRSVDPTNTTFANYSCITGSSTNPVVTIKGTTATPTATFGFTFNTNGTALLTYPGSFTNDGNVAIYNGTIQKYLITVTQTGRISSAYVN
jgi:prepilin-type N-terminal cleavage/methylation domain-containing protein